MPFCTVSVLVILLSVSLLSECAVTHMWSSKFHLHVCDPLNHFHVYYWRIGIYFRIHISKKKSLGVYGLYNSKLQFQLISFGFIWHCGGNYSELGIYSSLNFVEPCFALCSKVKEYNSVWNFFSDTQILDRRSLQ